MKKLFSLLAAVLFAGSMMAAVGNLYYTATFLKGTSANGDNISDYTKTGTYTTNGMSWTIPGNNTNGDYIRIGGKSLDNVDRSITSQAVMGDDIAKLVISHAGISRADVSVSKVTVTVASDANFQNDVVSTVVTAENGDYALAKSTAGTIEILPASGKWNKDSYYKITFTVSNSSSSNGGLDVKSLAFYSYLDASAPSITAEKVDFDLCLTQTGSVEKTAELVVTGANLTNAITYSVDGANTSVTGDLTTTGGTLNVKFSANADGEYSDTIILTSGTLTQKVAVEAVVLTTAGNGSKEAPFSVADVVNINNRLPLSEKYWVQGYMVGCAANGGELAASLAATNVALGDAADQTKNCVPVELPSGDIRTALNLVDNAGYVGRQVKVYGQLISYFLFTGVKAISDYELIALPVDLRMEGAYKVGGETPDFASLYDACVAIETNGIKGDVQLLICADLTETENPGLINNTDFAITIRPDKDEDRLIKFTKTTDNEGPSGAFVIGCDKGITFATTTTKNVTIDGFAEGGETRRLTFLTEEGFGSKAGPIIFYGDVSNSAIKNCIVKNTIYHATTSTYAVTLRTEKNTDKTPVNILIENNLLIATTAYNGQCVYFNGSQKATAAGNPHDIIVRNNELQASTRGIFCYGVKDVLIEGNIFKVNQISGGRLSHGVLGNSAAGVITIRNNKFVELTTVNVTDGDYGIQAITASGGATAWVIENNYFAGFGTGEVCNGKPTKVLGIRCGDSCVIRHNTIYMPALAYAPSTTLMSGNPISCLYLAGAKQYIAENNLFVSEEIVANNSLIRGGLNPNVKNNVFFHKGGNAAVNAAAVVAKTWEEFTAEGANAGSKWAEPKFADAANGDLAITEKNEDLKVARLETVLKDIDGKDRAEQTYAGAFEFIEPGGTDAVDNIELREGAQKIFRNGEVLIIRDGKTYNMMGQTVK